MSPPPPPGEDVMLQLDTTSKKQGRRKGQMNNLSMMTQRSLRSESQSRVVVTRNQRQRQTSTIEDLIPVDGNGRIETDRDCPDVERQETRQSIDPTISSSSTISTSPTLSTSSDLSVSIVSSTPASTSSTPSNSSAYPIRSTASSDISASSTPSSLITSSTTITPTTLSTVSTSSVISTSTTRSTNVSISSSASTMSVMLDVSCGSNRAQLRLEDLRAGSRGSCIILNDLWMTPNEFQSVSGRGNAKDWKRSIKHYNRSLKFLLGQGLMSATPPFCICETCDSQIFNGSPGRSDSTDNVRGTCDGKGGRGAKDRKSQEPSTMNDLRRRRPATGRRTSKPEAIPEVKLKVKPEIDDHCNKNVGRQQRMRKSQLGAGEDFGDVIVGERKRGKERIKGTRKGTRKEFGARRKKGAVDEAFQGRSQPVIDEDSTIIDGGEMYMEMDQSIKVVVDGTIDGMNGKTEAVKVIGEWKKGASRGRQKEAEMVTERNEGDCLPGVQPSGVGGTGSKTWKECDWVETIGRELDGRRREELVGNEESRRSNGHGSRTNGNMMTEEVDKTILNGDEDKALEYTNETTAERDEELNKKKIVTRGKRSRPESNVAKNTDFSQKFAVKSSRTEMILVVPNYQRETAVLPEPSSVQNSNENNREKSAEAEDCFQSANGRDALKKKAQRRSNKLCCDYRSDEVTPQRTMTGNVESRKSRKTKGHRTVTSKMADSTTKVDVRTCNKNLEIAAKDITIEVPAVGCSRKEKILIESIAEERNIDDSAYYRPPEAANNPPLPFRQSVAISTNIISSEDIQSDGIALATTTDWSNPLSGMRRVPLEKRGRITGFIPGSHSAQSSSAGVAPRKRKAPPETTDATTSGKVRRRRCRRNQNGVVSSTTADFLVADPPTMTSQKEERWSRDDGNYGDGCYGDVARRRSVLSASGFSGSRGSVVQSHSDGGCASGILVGGGEQSGERGVSGKDNYRTQSGDASVGSKFDELEKSKEVLCGRQGTQTSEAEIPDDGCYGHALMIPPFPRQSKADNPVCENGGAIKRGADIERVAENPEEEAVRMDWTTAVPRGTGISGRAETRPIFDSCGALDLTLPKIRKD